MVMDLELRKTYLGGTDLTAVSGINPYMMPGDTWLEKVEGTLWKGNDATQAGVDLEPIVAMRFARRQAEEGHPVELLELDKPIFHPKYPFIAANPDRLIVRGKRILECKTADEMQLYDKDSPWGEDGEVNKVPIHYFGQTNIYINITEFLDGVVTAFFLGRSRFQRDYPITPDQELYDMLIRNGVEFWEKFIAPKKRPPLEMFSPDVVMKALASGAHVHGGKKGVVVEPDDVLLDLAERYKDLSDKINALEDPKKMLAGRIAQWISAQNATKVLVPAGSLTYQKPEPKPAVRVINFEAAWTDMLRQLPAKVPDGVAADLLTLANNIKAKYTDMVTPEPATPRLHPHWK